MSASGGTTRRAMLLGAGAVGAAGVLAACGGASNQPAPEGGPATPAPPAESEGAADVPTSAAAVQDMSVPVSDIPVGGGKIFPDKTLVVTQPTEGQFKAFDATCTHQQCLVGSIDGGLITCPCHGSQFHIDDGAVARGPAPRSLDAKHTSVSDGRVVIS